MHLVWPNKKSEGQNVILRSNKKKFSCSNQGNFKEKGKKFCNDQCVPVRFPVSSLSDGKWHHVAVSVSAKRLALYVDCSLLESVDWVYQGMGISTDGLLMVGGIVQRFDTPFEVSGSTLLPLAVYIPLQALGRPQNTWFCLFWPVTVYNTRIRFTTPIMRNSGQSFS